MLFSLPLRDSVRTRADVRGEGLRPRKDTQSLYRGPILERLLSYGFFPRELPPSFSTKDFGSKVSAHWATLPDGFCDGCIQARAIPHSTARSGLLRRQLSILNPVSYAGLSFQIEDAWPDLRSKIECGLFSISRPIFHPNRLRAFVPWKAQSELPARRARDRSGRRFVARADVSRFYFSVYSHSIPWALHGKSEAKIHRKGNLLGNRIDQALRSCRDGQTVGIAIGPDTSHVIAELLLSQVDVGLSDQCPNLRGVRYIDDYEFAVSSYNEAEEVLGILEETLSRYELALNPHKTEIRELPLRHESRWVSELRQLPLRDNHSRTGDLVHLFDRTFELAVDHPGEAVVRYLMGRLVHVEPNPKAWDLYQSLLLQCLVVEPGSIAAVTGILAVHRQAGLSIDFDLLQDCLSQFVSEHTRLGHHNEAAWAIWAAMVLEIQLDSRAVEALERTPDSTVALLTLEARKRSRLVCLPDTSRWEQLMRKESLCGDQWLLAYEALVQNYLPSAEGDDYVSSHRHFGFLAEHGVRFFNPEAVNSPQLTGVAPSLGIAPFFYV